MGKTYECPFYRWEEKMKIHCEGGTVNFLSKGMRQHFTERYCSNERGWKFCTIAGCLCRCYEDELT